MGMENHMAGSRDSCVDRTWRCIHDMERLSMSTMGVVVRLSLPIFVIWIAIIGGLGCAYGYELDEYGEG